MNITNIYLLSDKYKMILALMLIKYKTCSVCGYYLYLIYLYIGLNNKLNLY